MDLSAMTTESRNVRTMELDRMSALEIVSAMNLEDREVPVAVSGALEAVARLAEAAADAICRGGRLIYVGAGTSGRLGVLDAAECVPTFGVPEGVVVGLIAGGEEALVRPVEGAEDSAELGRSDLASRRPSSRDVVVGVAASGRTPYVLGALALAHEMGCLTAAVACNRGSAMGCVVDIPIEVEVGPEVLTGSTRLKAGTAQKLVLNMVSTAAMALSGKVYQNLMVDVMQSNEKLGARAESIVMECTGVCRDEARAAINAAGGSVKVALVSVLAGCGAEEARDRLVRGRGRVRDAVSL